MNTIFYNAHHSPIGAFASFTLGFPGAKGGLGLELGQPADSNVYIGVETRSGGRYEALPFFAGAERGQASMAGDEERKRYDVEGQSEDEQPEAQVAPFRFESITRDFRLGSDTWQAGDLTFRVLSPMRSVPDPETADEVALKAAIVPAVLAEIVVDNRRVMDRAALFSATPAPIHIRRCAASMIPPKAASAESGRGAILPLSRAMMVCNRGRAFPSSRFWAKPSPKTGLSVWVVAPRC
jgi:hypothetical protein